MTNAEALTLKPGDLVCFTDNRCDWLGYPKGKPITVHRVAYGEVWFDFGLGNGVLWGSPERVERYNPEAAVDGHVHDLLNAFRQ